MMKWLAPLFLALAPSAFAQSSPVGAGHDPFASLSFLLGTWEAKTINTPDVIRMPGQQAWKSYLEWTGARQQ